MRRVVVCLTWGAGLAAGTLCLAQNPFEPTELPPAVAESAPPMPVEVATETAVPLPFERVATAEPPVAFPVFVESPPPTEGWLPGSVTFDRSHEPRPVLEVPSYSPNPEVRGQQPSSRQLVQERERAHARQRALRLEWRKWHSVSVARPAADTTWLPSTRR